MLKEAARHIIMASEALITINKNISGGGVCHA
jgi:hypothetical protein